VRGSSWYAGLVLSIATIPFWFLARWQLGGSFTVSAQARHLVTTGIYARFRHPVYVFGGMAWTGALIVLLGWKAITIGVFIAALEVLRAFKENRVLAEAFGEEYDEYRKQVWF
jgi:protein-S-isoprenylcysteine O-methyltransferase Ste14